jgi:hypothetical protein
VSGARREAGALNRSSSEQDAHGLRARGVETHAALGDYPDAVVFASESEFLEALRKFYDWETSKNVYPEKVSELVAWRLMLRLLRT